MALRYIRSRRKIKGKIVWNRAADIESRVKYLVKALDLASVKVGNIHFYRSQNANTRAYARIWGLSRIWQLALEFEPSYILEVISEKFDDLPQERQDEILLHELAHIPKNFSGALMPHKKGHGNFHDKLHEMIAAYKRKLR